MQLLFIALLGAGVSGCGGCARSDGGTTDADRYTHARFVRRVFPDPPTELFGVRGLSIDSTGALHILDSEDYRIYVLNGSEVRGSTGRKGSGPGEFPDTPVYMDSGRKGVLVTVGGSHSRAAFFSNEPAYAGTFSPGSLVLQAVHAPFDRIVASTLNSPTDPVLFDRQGRELMRLELGNDGDTIMDHFIMDAGTAANGRALLVVGYHFRNRVQVVDLDSGEVMADFAIHGLPPTADTRPNPSLRLFPEGQRPASVPMALPTTTLIQNILVRGDRIYIHLRDHTTYRGREIHEVSLDGALQRIIVLPEPAFAVEISAGGLIYATADTATVVNLYAVD
ncbi:MAG: hypothetical protein HKN17_11235 [Rhodothermales bacterium]|nr:hypothetical protein [Rhodothermales bacterium]